MKLEKLETWKDSFRNYSQWVNTAIGVLGAAYLAMTPEMRMDLPNVVISVVFDVPEFLLSVLLSSAKKFLAHIPQAMVNTSNGCS